jgi:hypothetical protein
MHIRSFEKAFIQLKKPWVYHPYGAPEAASSGTTPRS